MTNKPVTKSVFVLLMWCFSFIAHAQVVITINGEVFQYNHNPRLSEVLEPVALHEDWYWPASALYNLNGSKDQLVRIDLNEKIRSLFVSENKVSSKLYDLKRNIDTWHIEERVELKIDYDLARMNPDYNPMFQDGNYLLHLKKRPSNIAVFGNIDRATSVQHIGATNIAHYMHNDIFSHVEENQFIYVIDPHGTISKKAKYSDSDEHFELMPGSTLYIPFENDLPIKTANVINRLVAELSLHRIKN